MASSRSEQGKPSSKLYKIYTNRQPIPESGYVTPHTCKGHSAIIASNTSSKYQDDPNKKCYMQPNSNEKMPRIIKQDNIKKRNYFLLPDTPKISSQVSELIKEMKKPPSNNGSRNPSRCSSKPSSLCSQTSSNSHADSLSEKSFSDLTDKDPFEYPGLLYKHSHTRSNRERSADSRQKIGKPSIRKQSTDSLSGHESMPQVQEEYRKWYTYMKTYERFCNSPAAQIAVQLCASVQYNSYSQDLPSIDRFNNPDNQKYHDIYFKPHFRASLNAYNCLVRTSSSSFCIFIEQIPSQDELLSLTSPITIDRVHPSQLTSFLQSEKGRIEADIHPDIRDPSPLDSLVLLEYLSCLVSYNGQPSREAVISCLGQLYTKYSYLSSRKESKNVNYKHYSEDSRLELVDRFRNLLLRGRTQEAIDYACSKQLWEYALSLVSHSTGRVAAERIVNLFLSNCLESSDLIVKFHEAWSGQSTKYIGIADDSLSWLSHLVMLISNRMNSENVEKWDSAVLNLAENLSNHGRCIASQLCYLSLYDESAFVDFCNSTNTFPGIHLLGVSKVKSKRSSSMKTCSSSISIPDFIRWTEVYEYCLALKYCPAFALPTLQVYRLHIAGHLFDQSSHGSCLEYVEVVIKSLPNMDSPLIKFLIRSSSHLLERMGNCVIDRTLIEKYHYLLRLLEQLKNQYLSIN